MDTSYKRKNYQKPARYGSNSWSNKKRPRNYLQPGMRGFLCTCNTREKDCVKESLNILNEYGDKLFGSDEILRKETNSENVEETANEAAGGDIEDELKEEVSSLKASKWTPGRFSSVDTGVKNNIFIKTTLEDPVKLVYAILNDIAATKIQKARFLLRIVPVEVICKANLEDIKSAADTLFDKHFRCEPTTFAIVVNKRCNDSVLRDEVIHAVALLVTDKNIEHKANLKDAKHTVLLEIMKSLCCISVLEDYKKLRHYSLAELAKPEVTDIEKPEGAEPEKPVDENESDDGKQAAQETPKECEGSSETVKQ